MTNGRKLLLTYPNLYVCALYFDMNFVHIRNRNINYKMNDNKTCVKIPINWWNAPYKESKALEQQKTGHWIDKEEKTAVCSCCNRNNLLYGDFCKWCGEKMAESEGKE